MTSTNTTAPTAAAREKARCCGTSVGARIRRRTAAGTWEYLLIGRAWWPLGWAAIAGHVYDAHATPLDAVKTEVLEEGGLTVVSAVLVDEVPLGNLCQAPPSARHGHHWWVYDVEVTGELRPDAVETTGARWVSASTLQAMADATVAHALAGGHARDLDASSLEAVWVELFARLGDIEADADARVAAARLYSTPPDEEWVPVA